MSPSILTGRDWWLLFERAGRPKLRPRTVLCRTCGAPAGEFCRSRSGERAPKAHQVRYDDALRLAAGERLPDQQLDLLATAPPPPQDGPRDVAA